ncbi:MAG: glycosyltransferase family 39 protein [Acidimicrobiales bacterium]
MHAVSTGAASTAVPEERAPSVVPPPATPVGADDDRFGRRTTVLLAVATVVVVVVGVVLRFWTRSDLWLDEALTVNIARLPLRELPSFLRRDGAPPLFYVLLHVWMGLFGQSNLAVRSLSGVMGVATIPLIWLAGRRIAGRNGAWAAMLLLASSPFAVRYDTEARMYALVALLTVLGFLALDRVLQRPRPGNLVAVAAVTGLLLYSHYWSLYLVATVFVWLGFEAWRGRPAWRRHALPAMGAVAVGGLTFVPWVPIFVYQSAHTGTPWATPANFAAMVDAVASFAGGATSQGRALALIYFALVGLGLFGVATDRRHIELDIRTRPLGRPLGVVIAGTLALAIAGGFLTNSAFDPRYASVVFVPLILLVAVGLGTFADRRVRLIILAVAVVAGLAASFPNVTTDRTQAGEVAAAIARRAKPGDVVAYCPDQLGPAVDRLLPADTYRQITFPRGTGPEFVDWVDYAAATRAGKPAEFATHLESMAGAGHQIFVVWAPGYQTLGTKCEQIVETLQAAGSGYTLHNLVQLNATTFYQPMNLYQFTPTPG